MSFRNFKATESAKGLKQSLGQRNFVDLRQEPPASFYTFKRKLQLSPGPWMAEPRPLGPSLVCEKSSFATLLEALAEALRRGLLVVTGGVHSFHIQWDARSLDYNSYWPFFGSRHLLSLVPCLSMTALQREATVKCCCGFLKHPCLYKSRGLRDLEPQMQILGPRCVPSNSGSTWFQRRLAVFGSAVAGIGVSVSQHTSTLLLGGNRGSIATG